MANGHNSANFAWSFRVTVEKWEKDWKALSDACQYLEEERIELKEDIVWACADAMSIACVFDEEVCASQETKGSVADVQSLVM